VGYKSRIRRKISLIALGSLLNVIAWGCLPSKLALKPRPIGLEKSLRIPKLDLDKISPNYNLTSCALSLMASKLRIILNLRLEATLPG